MICAHMNVIVNRCVAKCLKTSVQHGFGVNIV